MSAPTVQQVPASQPNIAAPVKAAPAAQEMQPVAPTTEQNQQETLADKINAVRKKVEIQAKQESQRRETEDKVKKAEEMAKKVEGVPDVPPGANLNILANGGNIKESERSERFSEVAKLVDEVHARKILTDNQHEKITAILQQWRDGNPIPKADIINRQLGNIAIDINAARLLAETLDSIDNNEISNPPPTKTSSEQVPEFYIPLGEGIGSVKEARDNLVYEVMADSGQALDSKNQEKLNGALINAITYAGKSEVAELAEKLEDVSDIISAIREQNPNIQLREGQWILPEGNSNAIDPALQAKFDEVVNALKSYLNPVEQTQPEVPKPIGAVRFLQPHRTEPPSPPASEPLQAKPAEAPTPAARSDQEVIADIVEDIRARIGDAADEVQRVFNEAAAVGLSVHELNRMDPDLILDIQNAGTTNIDQALVNLRQAVANEISEEVVRAYQHFNLTSYEVRVIQMQFAQAAFLRVNLMQLNNVVMRATSKEDFFNKLCGPAADAILSNTQLLASFPDLTDNSSKMYLEVRARILDEFLLRNTDFNTLQNNIVNAPMGRLDIVLADMWRQQRMEVIAANRGMQGFLYDRLRILQNDPSFRLASIVDIETLRVDEVKCNDAVKKLFKDYIDVHGGFAFGGKEKFEARFNDQIDIAANDLESFYQTITSANSSVDALDLLWENQQRLILNSNQIDDSQRAILIQSLAALAEGDPRYSLSNLHSSIQTALNTLNPADIPAELKNVVDTYRELAINHMIATAQGVPGYGQPQHEALIRARAINALSINGAAIMVDLQKELLTTQGRNIQEILNSWWEAQRNVVVNKILNKGDRMILQSMLNVFRDDPSFAPDLSALDVEIHATTGKPDKSKLQQRLVEGIRAKAEVRINHTIDAAIGRLAITVTNQNRPTIESLKQCLLQELLINPNANFKTITESLNNIDVTLTEEEKFDALEAIRKASKERQITEVLKNLKAAKDKKLLYFRKNILVHDPYGDKDVRMPYKNNEVAELYEKYIRDYADSLDLGRINTALLKAVEEVDALDNKPVFKLKWVTNAKGVRELKLVNETREARKWIHDNLFAILGEEFLAADPNAKERLEKAKNESEKITNFCRFGSKDFSAKKCEKAMNQFAKVMASIFAAQLMGEAQHQAQSNQ